MIINGRKGVEDQNTYMLLVGMKFSAAVRERDMKILNKLILTFHMMQLSHCSVFKPPDEVSVPENSCLWQSFSQCPDLESTMLSVGKNMNGKCSIETQ